MNSLRGEHGNSPGDDPSLIYYAKAGPQYYAAYVIEEMCCQSDVVTDNMRFVRHVDAFLNIPDIGQESILSGMTNDTFVISDHTKYKMWYVVANTWLFQELAQIPGALDFWEDTPAVENKQEVLINIFTNIISAQ